MHPIIISIIIIFHLQIESLHPLFVISSPSPANSFSFISSLDFLTAHPSGKEDTRRTTSSQEFFPSRRCHLYRQHHRLWIRWTSLP